MRKIIKDFISQSNIYDENKEFKEKRKRMFFSFFSFLAIFIFGFFTIFHFFFVDNLLLASCLMAAFLVFVFNLLYYYKTKNIDLSSTIIIVVSIVLLSVSVINGGYKNTGIYWIFVIPVVSFYYKGKKAGSILSLIFFSILFSILLLSEFKFVETSYSAGYFSVVLAVYLFLSLMIYFYEDTANISENIIRKQIYMDSLTRLPNRSKLIEDLTCSGTIEIILINVDDFKQINDIYGGNIGDQVLIELSKRLKITLKDSNCRIYKLHADEFAVLFCKEIRKSELIKYSKKILMDLTRDININKFEIVVSVSIGVAKGSLDVLSNADIALKTAKESKKDMIVFDKSMNVKEKYANNIKWVKIIKKALLFDNLVPYFQPIVNNFTGQIDKYECLVRLLDRDKVISPYFFLDIAKRSKIYPHITKVVILKSFEAFKNSNCPFSVNITVDDILNKNTRDFIYTAMKEYNNAKNVVFEIVESEKIEDINEVYEFIKTVKALGSKIAIDDFGSGYSNYEYILRLNVDYIKIDSSLIKNIATDKNSQVLIETIVDFTKKLNIQTIAEFVHSKEVYDKVKKLKIDFSQGFYLGEPGPKILK